MNEDRWGLDFELAPILFPVGLYGFFYKHGQQGRLARDVYLHLLWTARLQKTNQVRATDRYLAKGLSLGIATVRAAKAFLRKYSLLEYIQRRGPDGRMKETYIKLPYIHRRETVARALTAIMESEDTLQTRDTQEV